MTQASTYYKSALILLERYDSAANELHSHGLSNKTNNLDLIEVGYYLIGLSLELFLKGLYITQYTCLPKKLNHNLSKLAIQLITLDEEEQLILEQLEYCINWVSRYPIPKNDQEWSYISFREINKVRRGTHAIMSIADNRNKIDRLVKKVVDAYHSIRDLQSYFIKVINILDSKNPSHSPSTNI